METLSKSKGPIDGLTSQLRNSAMKMLCEEYGFKDAQGVFLPEVISFNLSVLRRLGIDVGCSMTEIPITAERKLKDIDVFSSFMDRLMIMGEFVACDDDRNYLSEPPEAYNYDKDFPVDFQTSEWKKQVEQYDIALKQVVFKGYRKFPGKDAIIGPHPKRIMFLNGIAGIKYFEFVSRLSNDGYKLYFK